MPEDPFIIYLLTNSLFFIVNNTSDIFLNAVGTNEYHIMQLILTKNVEALTLHESM